MTAHPSEQQTPLGSSSLFGANRDVCKFGSDDDNRPVDVAGGMKYEHVHLPDHNRPATCQCMFLSVLTDSGARSVALATDSRAPILAKPLHSSKALP